MRLGKEGIPAIITLPNALLKKIFKCLAKKLVKTFDSACCEKNTLNCSRFPDTSCLEAFYGVVILSEVVYVHNCHLTCHLVGLLVLF